MPADGAEGRVAPAEASPGTKAHTALGARALPRPGDLAPPRLPPQARGGRPEAVTMQNWSIPSRPRARGPSPTQARSGRKGPGQRASRPEGVRGEGHRRPEVPK